MPVFALLFFSLSVCFMVLALFEFAVPILESGDFMEGLVKGLHTGVVALAVFARLTAVPVRATKASGGASRTPAAG